MRLYINHGHAIPRLILMTARIITCSFWLFFLPESLSLDGKLHIPLVTAISNDVLTYEDENFFCTQDF